MFSNVQSSIANWHKIGPPSFVLRWISNGITLEFLEPPPPLHLLNPTFTKRESDFIDQEISDLKRSGAIRQCPPGDIPYCVSPIKTVAKKGNKLRLIHDLREVNKCISVSKFSNEGIDVVKSLLQNNDYMLTLDLKSGFHHCRINDDSQKYLGFYHKGFYYVWCVLPFGLRSSPYYFNKFIRPVVCYLRQCGLRLLFYVDDCILMCQAKLCTDHKDVLLHTLDELGLTINVEKSHLNFSTVKDFLGYTIDSVGNGVPQLSIRKDRVKKLHKHLRSILCYPTVKARKLAQVAGQCISMTKAILPGKLLLRSVYRTLKTKTSWDSYVFLDDAAVNDLTWWLHAIHTWNGAPIVLHNVDVQLTTDASSDGWGAVVNDQSASGLWNSRIAHCSSNERELLAIHMAILSFEQQLRGKTVQVLTDNISACAYINNLGGPSIKLTNLMSALWADCSRLGITLTARHLAGVLNIQADKLSRPHSPYEWRLHPKIFGYIDSQFGPHTVDRFASLTSTQLPRYNSFHWDPLTSGIDALAQIDWGGEMNFVNAPFHLIPRVLQLIRTQQAEATVIAPWWPAQPWFRDLLTMAVATPIQLPKKRAVIKLGPKVAEPQKNHKWRLFAWKVSGKNG